MQLITIQRPFLMRFHSASCGCWAARQRAGTNTYINGLRRAQHRPSEYLSDHITDRQLAAQDRHSSQGPRSAELDALDTLPDNKIADALAILPVQFRLASSTAMLKDSGTERSRKS